MTAFSTSPDCPATAKDLLNALKAANYGARVTVAYCGAVTVQAARNKYENGLAFTVVAPSGRYSVYGVNKVKADTLATALSETKAYITRYGLATERSYLDDAILNERRLMNGDIIDRSND